MNNQVSRGRSRTPVLITIIFLLMVLGGIINLLIVPSIFFLGWVLAEYSKTISLYGIVRFIEGVGLLIVAFGIRRMKKWALYAFTALTLLLVAMYVYLFLYYPSKQGLLDSPDAVIQVVVLTYLWAISKRFVDIEESKRKLARHLLLALVLGFALFVALLSFLTSKGMFLITSSSPILSGESCDKLEELWQRNLCYSMAANKKGDPSLCEKIVISQEDETSRANKWLCYSDVARNTKDAELCEMAGNYRDQCLGEYAKFHRDKSVCDGISDKEQVLKCKQSVP